MKDPGFKSHSVMIKSGLEHSTGGASVRAFDFAGKASITTSAGAA